MFTRNFLCNIRKYFDPAINTAVIFGPSLRCYVNKSTNTIEDKSFLSTLYQTHQRHGRYNFSHKLLIAAGAPPFLYYFKKKETKDEEQTILEKLKKFFLPQFILILFQTQDNTPVGQLIKNIKMSLVSIDRLQYERAEELLHFALRIAQDIQHFNAITLCFDIMANLAFERDEFEKAEKLFVAVMQRLMQKGSKEDDIEIIHLGMKVAEIAECKGELPKAEQGYKWALEKLEAKLKASPELQDFYTLYGLASDHYGRLLMRKGQYDNAKIYLKKSYDIFIQVNSSRDPEVIDLLNNLAVVHTHLDELSAAEEYITKALKLANYYEMENMATYQANHGLVLMRRGLWTEAKELCETALKAARTRQNAEEVEQAMYCLAQLEELQGTTGND